MPYNRAVMKRFQPKWLLLALALLAGQWTVLAHSAEHTAPQQTHDGLCVICIQSHNLEQAQTSSIVSLPAIAARFVPASQSSPAPADVRLAEANIRAPPHTIL